MQELVNLLREKALTIGSAESLTGGLFASEIVSIPHASEVYLGSIVSYANSVKEEVLKISKNVIEDHGVVSEEVVRQMADHASSILNTRITIAFSGNAGPDVLDAKPVGAIYTCIKSDNDYHVYYDVLSGNRNEIRQEIVKISTKRIINIINGKGE